MRKYFSGAALIVLITLLAFESQPLAIGAIHLYQRNLSPIAEAVGLRCRFTPTCSHYAEAVIERDGLVSGGWKAMKRVARCGPWTALGTVDEP